MLFNSLEFIFLFLPVAIVGYYSLGKLKWGIPAKAWLVLCSLFFYSWWNVGYLGIIVSSIVVNFFLRILLGKPFSSRGRLFLVTMGIILNVGLLGYYKYWDFFAFNFNALAVTNLPILKIALPLAISFVTFQQIAYLVDCYKKEAKESDLLNYSLFISFFPQLIAGPIVHCYC